MFKKLYLRLRYWKQIRKGFGLLSDYGTKKQFVKVNDRMLVMNGRDPLVKIDLSDGVVEQYKPPTTMVNTYTSKVEDV